MEKKIIRLTEEQLKSLIKESVHNIINESFNHWQSSKLAQMVKQHGMPYGHGTAAYFLTQLRDDNVADEVVDRPSTNKYIEFKDGKYVDINTNDNEVARDYFGLWANTYTNKYVDKVRPNNGFARSRDFNHISSDYYSKEHYKPSTRRADDARDLRHNPYFKDGKNKEYNRDSGWNRKEADRVMNNLRAGKDRYGNDNKPNF